MVELDEICKANGITYYLAAGCALGAIRQGRFLPWDDDIDIFITRDNWETAAAAFGKIEFDDPTNPGSTITAYGLVADALIGRIIVGESMYIANDSNTISLNGSGITIKNSNNNIVFNASTSGDAYISGRVVANSGKIGG